MEKAPFLPTPLLELPIETKDADQSVENFGTAVWVSTAYAAALYSYGYLGLLQGNQDFYEQCQQKLVELAAELRDQWNNAEVNYDMELGLLSYVSTTASSNSGFADAALLGVLPCDSSPTKLQIKSSFVSPTRSAAATLMAASAFLLAAEATRRAFLVRLLNFLRNIRPICRAKVVDTLPRRAVLCNSLISYFPLP